MFNKLRFKCLPTLLAVGLLLSTGAFMPAATLASSDSAGDIYVVKPGDTLSKIALSVYGSMEQYTTILDANRSDIVNADVIYPGQKLHIPGGTAAGADWRFHDIVNVAFVQQYAKLPKSEDVLIIDSRPKKPKYNKGYIPTAVSIPDSKFDQMTAMLPENKDTLLIFYCGGPT